MNRQQVEIAIGAGLELLGPKSEIQVPAKLNDGIFFLRVLLTEIAQGKVALQEMERAQDQTPPADLPDTPQQNPQCGQENT